MLRRTGKLLWIALTPIALTVLLAEPEVRAGQEHAAGAATDAAEAGTHGAEAHHGPDASPLKNFADFGYKSKDEHGGSLEPGEEHMPPPFAMP